MLITTLTNTLVLENSIVKRMSLEYWTKFTKTKENNGRYQIEKIFLIMKIFNKL